MPADIPRPNRVHHHAMLLILTAILGIHLRLRHTQRILAILNDRFQAFMAILDTLIEHQDLIIVFLHSKPTVLQLSNLELPSLELPPQHPYLLIPPTFLVHKILTQPSTSIFLALQIFPLPKDLQILGLALHQQFIILDLRLVDLFPQFFDAISEGRVKLILLPELLLQVGVVYF